MTESKEPVSPGAVQADRTFSVAMAHTLAAALARTARTSSTSARLRAGLRAFLPTLPAECACQNFLKKFPFAFTSMPMVFTWYARLPWFFTALTLTFLIRLNFGSEVAAAKPLFL